MDAGVKARQLRCAHADVVLLHTRLHKSLSNKENRGAEPKINLMSRDYYAVVSAISALGALALTD